MQDVCGEQGVVPVAVRGRVGWLYLSWRLEQAGEVPRLQGSRRVGAWIRLAKCLDCKGLGV